MFTLSTCPIDRGQTEFYGIALYKTPHHPRPVHVRWLECRSCNTMHAVNDHGKVLHSRKPFTKDEARALFPRGKERRDA